MRALRRRKTGAVKFPLTICHAKNVEYAGGSKKPGGSGLHARIAEYENRAVQPRRRASRRRRIDLQTLTDLSAFACFVLLLTLQNR
jgi:hypothetical protein